MDAGHVVVPDAHVDANSLTHDVGTLGHDTGTPAHDANVTTQRDTGACSAHCTSSAQCTSACGAVAGGGIRCCDSATSMCFVTHAAMCPAATPDSGSTY